MKRKATAKTRMARKSIRMPEYPEHERLKAIQLQSQTCGEFYEWLQTEKGIEMECHFDYERDEDDQKVWRDRDGNIVEDYADPETVWGSVQEKKMKKMRDDLGIDCRLVKVAGGPIVLPIRQPLTSLLAEFFGIDENKLEAEKRAMLDECRKVHSKKEKKCASRR